MAKEKLTKHITFKVNEEEYLRIKDYSKKVGMSQSEIIRSLLLTTIDTFNKNGGIK